MPRKTVKTYILMSKKKFIGYLAWSQGKSPTIRQLFIVEEERRKGYAIQLVKYFVKEEAQTPDDEGILFNIESPNHASFHLFAKLGYLEIKNDYVKGLKVGFCR